MKIIHQLFFVIVVCTITSKVFGEKVTYLPLYGIPDETQYSGHHEISTNTTDVSKEPLIIWFNGGPGCSSMTGAFVELGPYKFDIKNDTDYRLIKNKNSWLNIGHLLFIDQPLGTGFSHTHDTYANTQQEATNHLFNLIQGFFKNHPEYSDCDIFIAGESYAGKYVPSLANKFLDEKFPFKGLLLGNALVHPIYQRLIKADQVYNAGFIDYKQRQKLINIERECIRHMQQGFTNEKESPCHNIQEYYKISSGGINFYDITKFDPSYNRAVIQGYMNRKDVQENIHLKHNTTFQSCSSVVYDHFKNQVLTSSRPFIQRVLKSNIRVLLFNGIYDTKDSHLGTDKYIFELDPTYSYTPRNIWTVDGNVAGYVKEMKYLTFVAIHGAGHFVPLDQPEHSLDMARRFINNISFCSESSPLVTYIDEDGERQTQKCFIADELCSLSCRNGKCDSNGECVCNSGFTGFECASKLIQIEEFTDLNAQNVVIEQQETIFFEIKHSRDEYPMSINVIEKFNSTNTIFPFGSTNKVCLSGYKKRIKKTPDITKCFDGNPFVIQLESSRWLISFYNDRNSKVGLDFHVQYLSSKVVGLNWVLFFGISVTINLILVAGIVIGIVGVTISTFLKKSKSNELDYDIQLDE
eukprot:gene5882-9710_t